MAYAALSDVNVHLPDDKAQAQDADIINLNIDAQRLIKARLANTYELPVLAAWATPDDTPELIREIAGKLVAAKFYANLVAEDEADGSQFAQNLYDEAIATLEEIRQGLLTIIDPDGNPIDNLSFIEASFLPNNLTQPPSFSVAEVWS